MRRRLVLCLLFVSGPCPSVAAQGLDLDLDALVTFYGDNTEFTNPFGEGETIIGTYAVAFVEARLSERLAVRGGVFGNQRFGSDSAFDQVRPVLALVIGGPRSRFVLGTLETVQRRDGAGPDRLGPHGLLPPVQRETLAFERPWEAGMQWTVDTPRIRQDAWLNWQRVNTRFQREKFDTGVTSRFRLRPALGLRADLHYVHQGGQLSAVGPVSDSLAWNLGVEVGGPAGALDRLSLEAFALSSRWVPDRDALARARTGFATLVRLAAEERGWRLHGLLWRGDDFIKEEGDPNYQSRRRDGTSYRRLRDYAEAGLTRTFPLARDSVFEISARWHRVENDYEYSLRVLAVARLRRHLWHKP
jgi:hypothetical protein